ncbi:hypothetical protein [Cryobacterium sp. TMT4-31]|uniref:hypothetical protein n=1 Tax=Cryobacterium sp. TMT4-31 TaxID=1259259 RepID=UPI001068DFBD|nr:hypothetical protein [Cryobacterium sp. TMT4-31]TFC90271.1 hypothetical protein E3T19_05840 [Cryobacterium sp. TMT4-31]
MGVLLVSKRYACVLVALTLSLVTGCSQADETLAVPDTSEAPAAEAGPEADDLAPLALTVADLPSGGWSLEPSSSTDSEDAEVSTDKSTGDLCALDFASALSIDEADNLNGHTFTRETLDQTLSTGVFIVEDGEQVIADLSAELASCTEPLATTENGRDTLIEIDELVGGEAAIEGDSLACRQIKMTFGYKAFAGSICFVADGDLVVSTMTTGPSMSPVQAEEFAQLTNAATQKAFAAR